MSLSLWLLFIPAVFLLNIAPGPNNLLAMSNAARFGWTVSVLGGFGRLPAFALLVGLTAVGLGAILAASETAFVVLKWGGAVYLVYLGLKIWRAPVQTPSVDALSPGGRERPALRSLMRREFLIAISNPKAILIFTAFFPQFMDRSQEPTAQLLVMGGTFLPLEMIALALYALAGAGAGRFLSSPRGQKALNRVSGGALIAAGTALALTRR
jgi:threonine/homoserine/homoserine lactone efflux protein